MTATDAARGSGGARFVGQRVPRLEDGRFLTGRGRYVDDIFLPDTLHVAFARSHVALEEWLTRPWDELEGLAGWFEAPWMLCRGVSGDCRAAQAPAY